MCANFILFDTIFIANYIFNNNNNNKIQANI